MAAGRMKFYFPVGLLIGIAFGYWLGHRKQTIPVRSPAKPIYSVLNPSYVHNGQMNLLHRMTERVRIVCMIFTVPRHHHIKAWTVKQTWAKRCNAYFFVSGRADHSLPAIVGKYNASQLSSWEKTKFAYQYALKHYGNQYDFFLKADENTFVIVENLRKLLVGKNPNVPFMTAGLYHLYLPSGRLRKESSYVLSRSALSLMISGMENRKSCQIGSNSTFSESLLLRQCRRSVGIKFLNSLDPHGLERFHPSSPSKMVRLVTFTRRPGYKTYGYRIMYTGLNRCSGSSISFQQTSPIEMGIMTYFLYHLRPYGYIVPQPKKRRILVRRKRLARNGAKRGG